MTPRSRKRAGSALAALVTAASVLLSACATARAGETELINAQTPWRAHLMFGAPLGREEQDLGLHQRGTRWRLELVPGGATMRMSYERRGDVTTTEVNLGRPNAWFSPLPPADWKGADFDDHCWPRYRPDELFDFLGDYGAPVEGSAWATLLCLRTSFGITDPAKVTDLTAKVTCIGGGVVYVNGVEVGRGFLPAGEIHPLTPAADYPIEAYTTQDGSTPLPGLKSTSEPEAQWLERYQRRIRSFSVRIPAGVLKKGLNILAVGLHRAAICGPLDRRMSWNHLGFHKVELTSAGGAGVIPYAAAVQGSRVWSAEAADQVTNAPSEKPLIRRSWFWAMVWARGLPVKGTQMGNPFDPVLPIRMAAPRNGVCSGQAVVSNLEGLHGVKAEVGPLQGPGGAALPAEAVQVRYAVQREGLHFCDALMERPPEGAKTVPVWIIVQVPEAQAPGWYSGTLELAAHNREFTVRVQVLVTGATVPDSRDFTSVIGMMNSTRTLAEHYRVEPWSKEHLTLVGKTLALMGQVGNDVLHVPVICSDFQPPSYWSSKRPGKGSAEPSRWALPMVLWTRTADGLKPDLSVLRRVLDLYARHCGPPKAIVLDIWDLGCVDEVAGKGDEGSAIAAARPMLVGVRDPRTGAISQVEAPSLSKEQSGDFWRPVFDAVHDLVKERGWSERTIMLGLGGDARPGKRTGELLRKWAPYARWDLLSHFIGDPPPEQGKLFTASGIEVGIKEWPSMGGMSTALQIEERLKDAKDYLELPTARWQYQEYSPPFLFRTLPILWGHFGRLGLDFWTSREGGPTSRTFFSHADALAAPGPDGAVPTVRFQMFREGVQDYELRAAIVRAMEGLSEEQRRPYLDLLDEAAARVRWGSACLSQHELAYDWPSYAVRVQEAAAELAGVKTDAVWQKPPR